jgi:hypothetical protein
VEFDPLGPDDPAAFPSSRESRWFRNVEVHEEFPDAVVLDRLGLVTPQEPVPQAEKSGNPLRRSRSTVGG